MIWYPSTSNGFVIVKTFGRTVSVEMFQACSSSQTLVVSYIFQTYRSSCVGTRDNHVEGNSFETLRMHSNVLYSGLVLMSIHLCKVLRAKACAFSYIDRSEIHQWTETLQVCKADCVTDYI